MKVETITFHMTPHMLRFDNRVKSCELLNLYNDTQFYSLCIECIETIMVGKESLQGTMGSSLRVVHGYLSAIWGLSGFRG